MASACMSSFQLTLPIRGAIVRRPRASSPRCDFNSRSPYGERYPDRLDTIYQQAFQLTLPIRGAIRLCWFRRVDRLAFQLTLPIRGAMGRRGRRHPMRLFQLTLPIRGAMDSKVLKMQDFIFQLTLPIRGAIAQASAADKGEQFQLTLPIRGAIKVPHRHRIVGNISTHAPHTGSDLRT